MSRRDKLTEEQRRAVLRPDSVRTVLASAGAGKTLVLVETYLRHVLEEGVRPDAILAITFTRKAASEMKRRIVAELRAHGLPDAAQIAETGPIQTIHSFCERLLRENALAAGLDPDFDVLPEHELASWRDEALQAELAAPREDQPEAVALIERLAGTRGWRMASTGLRARIAAAVDHWLRAIRGSGHSYATLAARHENASALWRAMVDAMLPGSPFDPDDPPTPKDVADALRAMKSPGSRKIVAADPELESVALADACGLGQIALDVWRSLDQRMDASQAFDFAELEARAVRLVETNPDVRERLRSSYRAVLIDEAQDVNPVQYRLLDALRSPSQMMVGDPQQSIFGFRLADRTLFDRRTQSVPCDALTRNFRSAPGILRFVDDVFRRLWGEGYSPMAPAEAPGIGYAGVEIWRQSTQDTGQIASWVAALITEPGVDTIRARDVAILVRQSAYAAQLAEALRTKGIPYRIVGSTERFYTRMEVRDMANVLRAAADPTDDFALLAVLRSPFAGLSLDAVAMMGLDRPVAPLLRSFVSPVPEDGPLLDRFLEWFEPLSAHADRLAAWEVLTEVLRRSPYMERLALRRDAAQRLANVRKLLMLATEERHEGPFAYAERIRTIQAIQHREGEAAVAEEDEDAVSILTIHKSKGLEFPVVVAPDLHGALRRRPHEVLVDKRLGLAACFFGAQQGLAHRWLALRREEEEFEEELRVLYVALTRAERRLCVVAADGAGGRNLAQKLGGIFPAAQAPPPGLRERRAEP